MSTNFPLSLGTANLGAPYGATNDCRGLSVGDADAMLSMAWKCGIRVLDTASAYEGSEYRIGVHRKSLGHEFDIVSKSPPLRDIPDAGVASLLMEHCTTSLKRLGVGQLSGYLLHDADDIVRPAVSAALRALKQHGLTRQIGVSIYEPDQGFAAIATGAVDIMQVPVNVFDRRFFTSGLSEACRAAGISISARSIYLQGLLAIVPDRIPEKLSGFRPIFDEFARLVAQSDREPWEAALRFVLDQPDIATVVIGANSPDHIEGAVEVLNQDPLDAELVSGLAELAAAVPPGLLDPRTWPR